MKIRASAALFIFLSILLLPAAHGALTEFEDQSALTAATRDLCHRQVAMLGESNTHGDGHTVAFKVALVERLVNECGFDSVFFEASHYEFLHLAAQLRTGQPVSEDQLSAAIGGLWKFDREFQPLVPFLLAKAQAGQLSLGGIDDQSGELGQDYANVRMITEWAALLPQPQRQDCGLALHRRIYYDYPKDAPYSTSNHAQITACLTAIQSATDADKTIAPTERHEWQESISSLQRWISRDFTSEAEQFAQRDHSMFLNFEWLRRQQPLRHKIIIWAATVHIAKEGDPAFTDHTGNNFGSYVHKEYGKHAFSLGFSALTGSYRIGARDVHDLPVAPPPSLEVQALQKTESDAVYLSSAQLAAMGTVPGAAFHHAYETVPWADALDGIVVFQAERPPNSTR